MSTQYVIFSAGKYVGEKGNWTTSDYAMEIDNYRIATWLADYFGGTAIDIDECSSYENSYHKAVKEDVQFRLDQD